MLQLKSNAPEIKWIIRNAATDDFARSLDKRLRETGELTENMVSAVARILNRTASAVSVDAAGVDRIVASFNRAAESGLKYPKMYLGEFTFALAMSGRNKGAIWVTEGFTRGGRYLGKVADGKFAASDACTPAERAQVLDVCADPKKAAEAFGKETGRCACCGRELSDPVSIANSIGPICAERYGF
ncbi:hypothetical protein WJ68_15965 [Burkholderia ubonensis]|uniref:Uncharacterized protein n=1 Tax=Burkholderia ubonensis TaxID=101571 RepID=A0ABD4E144_9BURK|nr:hypothetical protein WJ68_15965 [Burkholderia ubonensis]